MMELHGSHRVSSNSGPRVHFGVEESWARGPPQALSAAKGLQPRRLEDKLGTLLPPPPPSAAQASLIQESLLELQALCEACVSACRGPAREPGGAGQLLPLGSYRMGVLQPDDEVDVVFVAPVSIPLGELQGALAAQLAQRANATKVCPVGRVGHLNAPGLCFSLRGLPIKLLLAQNIQGLPQPADGSVVGNIAGLLSREACERVLQSVPDVELFVSLLRFVRQWAKRRGVYGSYIGFLGGPAWAVCCARVCQMHPCGELSELARHFFRTLARWDWRQPMALAPQAGSAAAAASTGANEGPQGGMVVLLPMGPSGVSATPHVTETTAKITQKELHRAHKATQQVELQRAQWSDVVSMSKFFGRHRHYLQFDFMATSEEILAAWLAWARVAMQGLVRLFETLSSSTATLRPWPQMVPFTDAEWPCATSVFVGLHLERGDGGSDDNSGEGRRSFDLREPIVKFLEDISSWPEAGRHSNQFELVIRHVRLAELQQWFEDRQRGAILRQGLETGALSATAA